MFAGTTKALLLEAPLAAKKANNATFPEILMVNEGMNE
jgi:hypothetical protein